MLQHIVGLRHALCAEGVGLDDVGPGLQIAAVYVLHYVGARQAEHVVVALHLHQMRGQQAAQLLAPEVALAQAISLNHRAHRPVEHQNPLPDYIVKTLPHSQTSNFKFQTLNPFIARSISRRSSFSFSVWRLSNDFLPLQRAMSILARPLASMNTSRGTMV